ncbi:TRAP transporter large permease [Marispirochaeta aestuarii]|uniref:TRAP transporter large permease n=1 Tax=Marispirochaeta aestuarii TaxID=1963862 RepID=UPI002ABDC1B5|nr:TRAP transporter large permease [Marispirochaeta aestuarii]
MLWVLFLSFILLCLIRVPIAFAMFISSTLAIVFEGHVPLTIVVQRIWVGLNNFPLLAVPFFMVVGQLMNETGISRRLIDFSDALVGHLKGGMAHVNVVVSMIFAGISGVSSADTSGVGSVLIPAQVKAGYPRGFTAGITAASSTLGNIIPPSLMMIIYAATAGLSVGGMFLSGIIPGVLIGTLQMGYSFFVAYRLGIGGDHKFSFKRLWKHSKLAILALFIPIIVIGGIIFGIFTATEASSITVLYALVLALLYREASLKKIYETFKTSLGLFSLSLFCVAAASLWGWVLAFYNIPEMVVEFMGNAGMLDSTYLIFLTVVIIFLVIGTFMDAIPAIIILQPIIGQITATAGINPYHMGIVVVLTLAIGLITPPYGLCLLISADLAELSIAKATRAMVPFYLISLFVLAVAVFLPDLMLWIPRVAMPNYM